MVGYILKKFDVSFLLKVEFVILYSNIRAGVSLVSIGLQISWYFFSFETPIKTKIIEFIYLIQYVATNNHDHENEVRSMILEIEMFNRCWISFEMIPSYKHTLTFVEQFDRKLLYFYFQ